MRRFTIKNKYFRKLVSVALAVTLVGSWIGFMILALSHPLVVIGFMFALFIWKLSEYLEDIFE